MDAAGDEPGCGLVAVVVCLLVAIQVDEWRTRRRVEQLVQEMYGLKVGMSTEADVQAVVGRLKPWLGTFESPCTPDRCNYEILVADPLRHLLVRMPWDEYPEMATMDGIAGALHAHLGWAELYLTVEHGVLSSTNALIVTDVPKGFGAKCDSKVQVAITFLRIRTKTTV